MGTAPPDPYIPRPHVSKSPARGQPSSCRQTCLSSCAARFRSNRKKTLRNFGDGGCVVQLEAKPSSLNACESDVLENQNLWVVRALTRALQIRNGACCRCKSSVFIICVSLCGHYIFLLVCLNLRTAGATHAIKDLRGCSKRRRLCRGQLRPPSGHSDW